MDKTDKYGVANLFKQIYYHKYTGVYMPPNKSMIRVSLEVRKALKGMGHIGDSYDKVLRQLLKKEGVIK